MSQNSRRSARIQLKPSSTVALVFATTRIDGRIVDLSAEGLGVFTQALPPEGQDICQIKIWLPDLPNQVDLDARICHLRLEEEGSYFIGLEFVRSMSAQILIHYEKLLKQLPKP